LSTDGQLGALEPMTTGMIEDALGSIGVEYAVDGGNYRFEFTGGETNLVFVLEPHDLAIISCRMAVSGKLHEGEDAALLSRLNEWNYTRKLPRVMLSLGEDGKGQVQAFDTLVCAAGMNVEIVKAWLGAFIVACNSFLAFRSTAE
jgi:hypothetical protein